MSEITINKYNNSITFINNGIVFSQFGIAKEILDLIDNQQQEIERLNKELDKTRLSELNKEYIIYELEKWLEESIEKHTDDYIDWKYDRNVYLAGSEKLQNVFDKLQELKGDGSNE